MYWPRSLRRRLSLPLRRLLLFRRPRLMPRPERQALVALPAFAGRFPLLHRT